MRKQAAVGFTAVSLAVVCLAASRHPESQPPWRIDTSHPALVGPPLTPRSLQQLLNMAERWEVPQPPPGSWLVKVWAYQDHTERDRFALGFVRPDDRRHARVGFDKWRPTSRDQTRLPPLLPRSALDDVISTNPFTELYGVNFGLITGIQLIRSQQREVGVALIRKSLREDAGDQWSGFYSPAHEDPVLMLARSCVAATLNEMARPEPDFRHIRQRLERLVADEPRLASDAMDHMLHALQATISQPVAAAGSVEHDIAAFLLCGHEEHHRGLQPSEQTLAVRGFTAIPILIAQRDSDRLTNHARAAIMNAPGHVATAREVIDSYLEQFSNNDLASRWRHQQQGDVTTTERINAWWAEAAAQGEKAYVQNNTVRFDESNEPAISRQLLSLAEARYPELLPSFYEALLSTATSSDSVFVAITNTGAVDLRQQVKLLERAIATNSPVHRNSALTFLQKIDADRADACLIELLQSPPKSVAGTDAIAGLGWCVARSQSPDVWQAFHDLLERVDVGTQMELIDGTRPPYDAPPAVHRAFRAIFARYSRDKTMRILNRSSALDYVAAWGHERVSMRDFIHCHWSDWLRINVKHPQPNATTEEWKLFRDAVRRKLRAHHLNPISDSNTDNQSEHT